jgi:hypothetical protein
MAGPITLKTKKKGGGRPKDAQLAGTKEGRELVPLTRLKLDEEKRKHAGLAQENGFGSA